MQSNNRTTIEGLWRDTEKKKVGNFCTNTNSAKPMPWWREREDDGWTQQCYVMNLFQTGKIQILVKQNDDRWEPKNSNPSKDVSARARDWRETRHGKTPHYLLSSRSRRLRERRFVCWTTIIIIIRSRLCCWVVWFGFLPIVHHDK